MILRRDTTSDDKKHFEKRSHEDIGNYVYKVPRNSFELSFSSLYTDKKPKHTRPVISFDRIKPINKEPGRTRHSKCATQKRRVLNKYNISQSVYFSI